MRILFIGDVVGKPGRKIARDFLRAEPHPPGGPYEFIVANGENSAGGKGLTPETSRELFDAGVNVLTGGNHTWRHRDIYHVIDDPRIVRPLNYPPAAEAPGQGSTVLRAGGIPVAVVNVMGRAFMNHHCDPFAAVEREVERLRQQTRVILIDFHAETTSEKQGMWRLLDGRVTAVIGTHTHVQTADDQISAAGTAYLTDVGMTGAYDSILGIKTEIALAQMRTEMPVRHDLATGDERLAGFVVEADAETGRALAVERVFWPPRDTPRPAAD